MSYADITPPEGPPCDDENCPFHGTLRIRGGLLRGVVVGDKMGRTVVVQRDYPHYVPKYVRYERRRSRIPAHNPPCINARKGDKVLIGECRPISKTVAFCIVRVLERARGKG